jgi:hypothetical protein
VQPRRIRFRVAGPGVVVGAPADLSAPAGRRRPCCHARLRAGPAVALWYIRPRSGHMARVSEDADGRRRPKSLAE